VLAPVFEQRGGASKTDLMWNASAGWASAGTLMFLMSLPDRYCLTLEEVEAELRACRDA
jgi:hypothetical protein